jgi:hypothetical protein
MKKDEAERAIRYLVTKWYDQNREREGDEPSFGAFMDWLRDHHGSVLRFRTSTDVHDDVERWFAEELGQTWRY